MFGTSTEPYVMENDHSHDTSRFYEHQEHMKHTNDFQSTDRSTSMTPSVFHSMPSPNAQQLRQPQAQYIFYA